MQSEPHGAMRLEPPGPYRVPIPASVLDRTAIASGEAVALTLDPNDGRPRLRCKPASAASNRALTRKLSSRSGEDRPRLTLPKQCITAGGFVDCHAVPYTEPGSSALFVGLTRESGLSNVSLRAVEESYVSQLRQGDLAVSLSADLVGPLAVTDRLWFSLDHYKGQLFFVLEADEGTAPDGAVAVTANPNTDRETTSGLALHFPRVVGRLCSVGNTTLRWGRTESGNRLLGVQQDV